MLFPACMQLSAAELSIQKAEKAVEALGVQIQEQEAQLPDLREAAKAEPSEDQAGVLKKLAADIKKANETLEKVRTRSSCCHRPMLL